MIKLKKILNEQEDAKDSSAKFEQNMKAAGYRDVWAEFTSPTGVIFLPDGQYENMDTYRSDYAIIMGKDGVNTGYAIWCSGLDGYRSNPISKVTVSRNGGGILAHSKGIPGVRIKKIYLNDNILAKSGLSTKDKKWLNWNIY